MKTKYEKLALLGILVTLVTLEYLIGYILFTNTIGWGINVALLAMMFATAIVIWAIVTLGRE